MCSLQRNDSGNSSGDRNSASSASISSVESPYYPFMAANRRLFLNGTNYRHLWNTQMGSDQGYDSFSLSSTDSYPSAVVPSCGPYSPGKINPRLMQIPEDIQLMELINASTMLDCDKLCSEADILLLKSHEKEREGDLRAAAALSDSSAQKARSAMDAPYSNHQSLITAKMKHSMCVMRSASLHKRVKELEAEEKRRLKAESVNEYHHSRQSSRDSTHSRHSRQGSKDSKDGKSKEFATKHASLEMNKNRTNINEGVISAGKTLEIYATLPKKGSKKKLFQQSITSLSSLRIKNDDTGSGSASLYKDFIFKSNNALEPKKKNEANKKSVVSPVINDKIVCQTKPPKSHTLNNHCNDDLSDYYSEWEATRKSLQRPLQRTLSGSASCRENDSEYYGEVGNYQSVQTTAKKQHKVRRRLLMGGFMKRKNRSLPDLREGLKQTQSPPNELPTELSHDDLANSKTIAQISSKGFHQPHRTFITEHGLYQRPSLLKVNPPLIEKNNKAINSPNHSTHAKMSSFTGISACTPNIEKSKRTINLPNQNSYDNKSLPPLPNKSYDNKPLNPFSFLPTDSPRPPTPIKSNGQNEKESKTIDNTRLIEANFLKELAQKREEIMKYKNALKLTESKVKNSDDDLKKVLIKPNLKVPQIGNDECDSVHRLQSVELNANSNKTNEIIVIAEIHCPPTLTNPSIVASNSSNSVNKTNHLHSPPLDTTKVDVLFDFSSKSSVKNLASKFEKIMYRQENKLNQNQIQLNNNNISDHSNEQIITSCDSVRKAEAVTNNCSDNKYQNVPIISSPVPSFESNKPNDDYRTQSNIPSNIPMPFQSAIPMNSNCVSSPNLPHVRPNRPPDYQTAIKRIGMLRNDRIALNGFSPQTRPFYMNVSGNIVQHSPQRYPNVHQQSLTQPNMYQLQQTAAPKTNALDNSLKQTTVKQQTTTNATNKTVDEPIRKKNGFKKSVSFSDQVVLVACAEEYLPNPLLERILNKNNLNIGQQSI